MLLTQTSRFKMLLRYYPRLLPDPTPPSKRTRSKLHNERDTAFEPSPLPICPYSRYRPHLLSHVDDMFTKLNGNSVHTEKQITIEKFADGRLREGKQVEVFAEIKLGKLKLKTVEFRGVEVSLTIAVPGVDVYYPFCVHSQLIHTTKIDHRGAF